jgi:hypothetical protein
VSVANQMLRQLPAEGPAPEVADKMMLFGQFVGSWDLEVYGYPPDGGRLEYTGEWHFAWVLDGRGIQDVLVVTPLSTEGDVAPRGGKGSTLRVYDPELDAWWTSWMSPLDREFSTLLARAEGDRIVLDGQWTLGQPDREWQWIFFDIATDSFRWKCQFHNGERGSVRVVEEMWARRRRLSELGS